MNISKLTKAQVTELYPSMAEAFPEDELKPLSRILSSIDQCTYDCFGLWDNGTIRGYAYFVRMEKHLLFDYFSILPAYRNQGLGAGFLRLLRNFFSEADSVLVEVEDPEFADSNESRQLQFRRLQFYLRNGFRNTGVQVFVFNVHYLLLIHNTGNLNTDSIRELYQNHYRAMLPVDMYSRFIQV